jgi:hypothetical protein
MLGAAPHRAQARLRIGDFAGARALFGRTAGMVAVLRGEMRDALEWSTREAPDSIVPTAAICPAAFAAAHASSTTFDTNPAGAR